MAACGRLRVAGNAKTSSTWDHKQGPKKNENSTHQSTPTVNRNLEQRIHNVMILGGVRKQSRKQGRVTGASGSTHQSTPTVYRNLEQRIQNVMILGGAQNRAEIKAENRDGNRGLSGNSVPAKSLLIQLGSCPRTEILSMLQQKPVLHDFEVRKFILIKLPSSLW